jgi:spore coat-associated protein N
MALSRGLSMRAKVAATAVAVGGTAAVVGLGTYGAWTSTTTPETPTYSSGTVTLDYGDGTTPSRLSVGASAMAPGDTAQRGFTLRNNGTLNFASVSLGITASPTSLLDSDATNGLTVKIQKCSTSWTEVGASAPYTYTCGGTTTVVLASTPVATVKAAPVTLPGLASLTGGSDNLKATFELPPTANNTVQGLSSTLSVTFTATQRVQTDK